MTKMVSNTASKDSLVLDPEQEKKVLQRMIKQSEYYHGFLLKEEAERLLKKQGDFIVREALNMKTQEKELVLSVRDGPDLRHLLIRLDYKGFFTLDRTRAFLTVQDLIKYYFDSKHELKAGISLSRPVGLQPWEILDENIKLEKELGAGSFGHVHMGWLTDPDTADRKSIAVKTCEKADGFQMLDFLREASIMRELKHPNVVEFVGMSLFEPPPKLLLGLAAHGTLLKLLQKSQTGAKIALSQLISFCHDAACGMEYLSACGILHLDIAARNLLVTDNCKASQNKELLRALISDFGLSQKADRYTLQYGDHVSQRWAAPEVLKDFFATTKSDVWSFGVLVWEIFSQGRSPYPSVHVDRNLEFYLTVENKRMDPPAGCPNQLAQLMSKCWQLEPHSRPTFTECKRSIEPLYFAQKKSVESVTIALIKQVTEAASQSLSASQNISAK